MKIEELYKLYKQSYLVTTDTRKELKNTMFFALKGDNFNGNKYAIKALEKGASYAIVDEKEYQTEDRIILVDNVLKKLQQLSSYHRQQLNIPIIALTGSNGKTTTKELIDIVLKEKFKCTATKGNLNNHIGVPLTLLSMTPETEIGVVEMGANHPNEIEFLCEIALPDFGYITNFGKVHLEGFGSLKGVIKAKTELYDNLRENNKTVFVNANDEIQVEKSIKMNKVTFDSKKSDFPVEFLSADPFVCLKFNNTIVQSKLIGKYNFLNIATAIAFGQFFKVDDENIKAAIENYIPSNNRSQIINKGTNKIILDAYNANPNSIEVALENLSLLTDKNKIAILGDMFEIGKNSLAEHTKVIDQAKKIQLNYLILIGENFSKVKIQSKKIFQFKSYEDFNNKIDRSIFNNSTILIKASRGMALERILDVL